MNRRTELPKRQLDHGARFLYSLKILGNIVCLRSSQIANRRSPQALARHLRHGFLVVNAPTRPDAREEIHHTGFHQSMRQVHAPHENLSIVRTHAGAENGLSKTVYMLKASGSASIARACAPEQVSGNIHRHPLPAHTRQERDNR
ncbi:hypothetical protein [Paraburkholderia sp. J8-2]|uniref:hypothetical protein n=1 Tax=Paraburkholderia sp. J8-2 TaxID=2805440 RepID=UPI002AB6B705|nr:hypothetical protein [Paraburkholderia sp. J8-2]